MPLPPEIAAILAATPARVGLAAGPLDGPLDGPDAVLARADEDFTQASAIKIPVLWELHRQAARGELSLEEATPIDPLNGAGGCGLLQSFLPRASRLALADLGVLMIVLSDNVATNLLIDRLGFDAVNALLDEKGGGRTRLRRKMIDLEARRAGRENTSTPGDAARLMRRLAADEAAGDPAAAATLRVMRLRKESPVTAALPRDARLATKPGMLDGLRTEWSIVEARGAPYVSVLMADGADDADLEPLFRRLAAALHAHFVGDGPPAGR